MIEFSENDIIKAEENAIKRAGEVVYNSTENVPDHLQKKTFDMMLDFMKTGIRLMVEEIYNLEEK